MEILRIFGLTEPPNDCYRLGMQMTEKNFTRLFRSKRYASIGGVCAGMALSRGYSVILTRIGALFLLSMGIGFVLYIAFWLLLPTAQDAGVDEPNSLPNDSLGRDPNDKVISGVCGGISQYMKVDSNLVRVIYLLLVLVGGFSIVPYIYAWFVLPLRQGMPSGAHNSHT